MSVSVIDNPDINCGDENQLKTLFEYKYLKLKKILKFTFPLLGLFILSGCNSPDPAEAPMLENFEDKSKEVEVKVGTPENPRPPQYVTAPPVPAVVTFAGDTLPLHREDVREGLEYELIVNTFRHSRTMTVLKNMERWRPLIEKTLEENQIPVDFIYLAVAESEFDNTAESYAGAVGMWQFMEKTAKDYDLDVNKDVDMRRDPKLATEAAAKFLRWSYTHFNDWFLVAASYNRGLSGIKNNLKDQQVDSFFDLHLNPETARYVYRIIAFKLILENPEAYGYYIKPEEKYKPYVFSIETVDSDVDDLTSYAKARNTTYKELRTLNPWFNNTSNYKLNVPRKGRYEIRVPVMAGSGAIQ